MKLDLSAAWDQAMKLVAANREVVLILAGVFFFLPYLAFSLFLPEMSTLAADAENMEPDAVLAAMTGFYADYWWALVLLALVQSVGMIAVLAVIGDPQRPTVGMAMERGVKLMPTQIGAQLLSALVIFAVPTLAFAIGLATGSRAAAVLLILLALPVMLYLVVKLSLTAPVIAIERQFNPVAALGRSWRLTKKNSLRLFFFYLLLLIAFWVISAILTLVLGLGFALFGDTVALVGTAAISSLINAGFAVIAYAVLASVHRQLANATPSVPKAGGH